jgi:hypothetical protein
MKRIDVSKPRGPKHLTAIVVGESRSGKTRFAGTWPRPIFLCDASEHGWTTLEYMNDADLYESGHRPDVVAIESPRDMATMLAEVRDRIAKEPHSIGTVVIDSLTFYADAYFANLEVEQPDVKDKRKLYGELHSHLRYVMIQFHKLAVNVLWLALPKEGDGAALGGALIAGQTATKAPARCDLWLFLHKEEQRRGDDVDISYDLYTESFRGYKAGHRFGDRLPRKLSPDYTSIESALGMRSWLDRVDGKGPPALPPAGGNKNSDSDGKRADGNPPVARRRRRSATRASAQS